MKKHGLITLLILLATAGVAGAQCVSGAGCLGGGGGGGGGSGTVNSGTGPAIAQYLAGTGTVVGAALMSGDCTFAQGGVITCAGLHPIFIHALSGATPTVAVNSATSPATDVQNFPLTTNVTSITLPAAASIADGEIVHLKIVQGAGAYTLPAGTANTALTAGAGATLVNLVPGGCPAIGTVSGNELIYDVLYTSSITEYEVMGCETNPAQANGAPPTGTAGGDLSGTYPNPIVINGSNMAGSASIPDSALATPHLSSGTNTIQASVGSGNFTSLTVSQDATINGATGAATVDGILTKSIPTLPVSASALSYSGTAFSWVPYFPNPLSETGDLLVGVTNVNTAPTRLPDVAVGSVLLSGGVGVNPSYGSVPAAAIPANPAFSATNSVGGAAGSAQSVMFEDGAPPWMHSLYDATDTITDSTQNLQGTFHVASFTLSLANTITVTNTLPSSTAQNFPRGGLVIFSQGACVVHGTISAVGIFGAGVSQGNGAGTGAGGGGTTINPGIVGNTSPWFGGANTVSLAPVGAAGTSGVSPGTGGSGAGITASAKEMVLSNLNLSASLGGSQGGIGGVGNTGTAGNPGGGGGAVVLICASITVDGTITVAGGPGIAGGNSTTSGGGGGGGGGGGILVLASRTAPNTAGSTLTITGGAAGTGGTGTTAGANGGVGGTGWQENFTLN